MANGPARAHFFAAPVLSNTIFALAQFAMLLWDYAEAWRKAEESAAKNDFYHRMSHDILTPLTRISTSVQVAKRIPENISELLTEAQDDVMLIAGMVNEALESGEWRMGNGEWGMENGEL
ncbi:hypothetical protein AGMMS50276_32060 [Synergistales bacterium]|nr:hypothetical protein AGMMS50276_32060 [Synergistales bacterium]